MTVYKKGSAMLNISNVVLSTEAATVIIKAARDGYLARYKEERLGILLGRLHGSTVSVSLAKVFQGGIKTRTTIEVNSRSIESRISHLSSRHRLRFLGTFHTHPEVKNSISSALSKEDKVPICEKYMPLIEVVATIWANDSPVRQSQYYCQVKYDDYRIRIAAHHFGGFFPIVPVSAKDFK